MRVLTEPKIVLASHNKGKLREIQALLAPFGIACVSAGELGLEEPVETETSFRWKCAPESTFCSAGGRSAGSV
jgi:XTP/dITP diphosphohydrolase